MTDTTDIGGAARPAWVAALMLGAIAANLFAVVTVNYWIYYARAAFIATHPGYVAVQPPTISRAISDPAIGEPFAVWVTLSGAFLVFGVLVIALNMARIARAAPFETRAQARMLLAAAAAVVVCQTMSSVGMYYLSHFRFPDHNETHMMGSYLFFIAQCLVIAAGIAVCLVLLRSTAAMDRLQATGYGSRRWVRFRAGFGCFSVALTLVYMALFQAKGMDFGTANAAVYDLYVTTEPLVITSFLLFLAMFQTDLWAVARGRTRL